MTTVKSARVTMNVPALMAELRQNERLQLPKCYLQKRFNIIYFMSTVCLPTHVRHDHTGVLGLYLDGIVKQDVLHG